MNLEIFPYKGNLVVRNDGEGVATYGTDHNGGGFVEIAAAERRLVTLNHAKQTPALFFQSHSINSIVTTVNSQQTMKNSTEDSKIFSEDVAVYRGSITVGLCHEILWKDEAGEPAISERRTVRFQPSPCSGTQIELRQSFMVESDKNTSLPTLVKLLTYQPAPPLLPTKGGYFRSPSMQEQSGTDAWVSFVGVVEGLTVGFALMVHPNSTWHPMRWRLEEEAFHATPLPQEPITLLPKERYEIRWCLQTHVGYVEAGWVEMRFQDWVRGY